MSEDERIADGEGDDQNGSRTARASRRCARIHVHDVRTGEDIVIHESREVLFEAPKWSHDGSTLLLRGAGRLWALAPEPGATPSQIVFEGMPETVCGHALDPVGGSIYVSANDGQIYRASLAGGAAARVEADRRASHLLHAAFPDGKWLLCTRVHAFDGSGRLAVVPATGGASIVLDAGVGHVDGAEWSPDGDWIYFATDRWAKRKGHTQLARVRDTGRGLERLVSSRAADRFPHLARDGCRAVYLELPLGAARDATGLEAAIVVVDTADWGTPVERISVLGGPGTMEGESWAPDAHRFVYVSYPACA